MLQPIGISSGMIAEEIKGQQSNTEHLLNRNR
jgi:hypothetical protein